MDLERLTDEQLLAIATAPRAGLAFGQFYRRHERLVVAFHMRRAKDAEVAADLTSETFARALTHRYRFVSQGEGAAVAWLYGIAHFAWLEYSRRASSDRRLEDRVGSVPEALNDSALEAIEQCAEDSEVVRALELLPTSQREAVRAFVLGDLGYDEIAEQAGCEPATVRKRVSRGLAALRGSVERA